MYVRMSACVRTAARANRSACKMHASICQQQKQQVDEMHLAYDECAHGWECVLVEEQKNMALQGQQCGTADAVPPLVRKLSRIYKNMCNTAYHMHALPSITFKQQDSGSNHLCASWTTVGPPGPQVRILNGVADAAPPLVRKLVRIYKNIAAYPPKYV